MGLSERAPWTEWAPHSWTNNTRVVLSIKKPFYSRGCISSGPFGSRRWPPQICRLFVATLCFTVADRKSLCLTDSNIGLLLKFRGSNQVASGRYAQRWVKAEDRAKNLRSFLLMLANLASLLSYISVVKQHTPWTTRLLTPYIKGNEIDRPSVMRDVTREPLKKWKERKEALRRRGKKE